MPFPNRVRPELWRLGGEECFQEYAREFDASYRTVRLYDVFGNWVSFRPDRAEHVCFKADAGMLNTGPRDVWSQERAERMSWIYLALTDPFEVRGQEKRGYPLQRIYMIDFAPIPEQGLPYEYYGVAVSVDKDVPGKVHFESGYPVDHKQWARWTQGGKRIPLPPQHK